MALFATARHQRAGQYCRARRKVGMRLPGTRYQEPGWEEVRKLLGQCSLQVLRACAHPGDQLAHYTDAMADALDAQRRGPRAQAAGNSYGDTVFELALSLVYELQAR